MSQKDESPTPIILNLPLNWVNWGLSEQAKTLRFSSDGKGELWTIPMVIVGKDAPGTSLTMQTVQAQPTLWKAVLLAASGNLWTTALPTNCYRLMGGLITISKDAASAGAFAISIENEQGGTPILIVSVSAAALVATGQVIAIPFSFPGNGYRSIPGQTCYCTFSNALTAGNVVVNLWGTEDVIV